MFAVAAAKQIAAMIVSLGGFDAIVFTGGIGENDALMRDRIAGHLSWAQVAIDPSANAAGIGCISAVGSLKLVHVLRSSEQHEIVWIVAAAVDCG